MGSRRAKAKRVRSAPAEFNEILRSGPIELRVKPLDMPLVVAPGLKHAFLAACLHQQAVPESDDVARVRAVLLAARKRDRDALLESLARLKFEAAFGWVETTNVPPVFLLETEEADPHWVFLLGGRFVLHWPIADVQPRAALHN